MVIIKYNTMAMRTKSFENNQVMRKRNLRSTSKPLVNDNNNNNQPADKKALQQIKKQFEHQQIINTSKSAQQGTEDIKAIQEQLLEKVFESENSQKQLLPKNACKNLDASNHIPDVQQSYQKKEQPPISVQLGQNEPVSKHEINLTTPMAKKRQRNTYKNSAVSPYYKEKKTYRKKKRQPLTSIPFRKCQDNFEQRIVTLINKIYKSKCSEKQIQNICDKMQKISNKDMFNPYVISGIHMIDKLLENHSQMNITTLGKLKCQIRGLKEKIWNEMSRTDQYQELKIEEKHVDVSFIKPLVMRKLYRKLMQQGFTQPLEARKATIQKCETFFGKYQNQLKEEDIIIFLQNGQL